MVKIFLDRLCPLVILRVEADHRKSIALPFKDNAFGIVNQQIDAKGRRVFATRIDWKGVGVHDLAMTLKIDDTVQGNLKTPKPHLEIP